MTSSSEQRCSCLVHSLVWGGWEVCCRVRQQMHFTNGDDAWRFGSVSARNVKSPVTVSVCCSSNWQWFSFFPESIIDNTGDSFMTYSTKNHSAVSYSLNSLSYLRWNNSYTVYIYIWLKTDVYCRMQIPETLLNELVLDKEVVYPKQWASSFCWWFK